MTLKRELHRLQYDDVTAAEKVDLSLQLVEEAMLSEPALRAAHKAYRESLFKNVPSILRADDKEAFEVHGRDTMRAAIEALLKEIDL